MPKRRPGLIVGIGQTEYSPNSGRSELTLALEAVLAALQDANLPASAVDGLVTYSMDNSDPAAIAHAMGLVLRYYSVTPYGGGAASASIRDAAIAVKDDLANVVVVYRAMNERSGTRFGQPGRPPAAVSAMVSMFEPFGIVTPAQKFALRARRYMHEFGVSNSDYTPVSFAARKHAATNPKAHFFERPIEEGDHDNSRWIIEPVLRLLDCCLESDGAVAVVVADRAHLQSDQPSVEVVSCAQALYGSSLVSWNFYDDEIALLKETQAAGRQIWKDSGLIPSDIQTAVLYDQFTPLVLMQLEALGFCDLGEGKAFVSGGRIELGGALPVNTHGGQLGEAYIHGMNGVLEGVRQVRGTSVNQVDNVENVLVTSGAGIPTSAMILRRA